jgi:DNA-binding Xre family transcriptional regulator
MYLFIYLFFQLLTEINTSNLPAGKGRPVREADLTAICEPIV